MLLSKTIRLFLDSIGRRDEYEFYLRKFQSDHAACFALVVPDAESVRESGDLMTFDLQFLLRLELCPLVFLEGDCVDEMVAGMTAHGPYRFLNDLGLEDADECWRDAMADCLRDGRIPVLRGGGGGPEIKDVVPRFASRLHMVRGAGMLHTVDGDRVEMHVTQRENSHQLRPGDESVVDRAREWLNEVPGLHISVSSPLYLLQELFTVRGRGTIIRPGSIIVHAHALSEVDSDRLVNVIESAFGKKLKRPAQLADACDIYFESGYKGAAVLEPHDSGRYLSKFIVGTQARGEGVAQELWEAVCTDQPRLFWRSRADNPVNHWYERQADGHHRQGGWTVFWRGVDASELPGVIAHAVGRDSDFVESGTQPDFR